MKNWQKTFTYKSTRFVEQHVGEDDNMVRFYPNSLGILESLAQLSEPISRGINNLMGAEGRNYKTETKSFTEGNTTVEETIIGATDTDSQRERIEQRKAGVAALIESFGDGVNLRLLGKAWMDSMKEEFPRVRGGATPAEVEEFMFGDGDSYEGLEIPQMVNLMTGWLRANAKVFGDAGERMVGLVKSQIEARLQSASTSKEGPDPTNGEDSKTVSSPQLDSDSNLET